MGDSKKRTAVDMEFADGKTRTVKPLTIKQLRKFMKAAKELFTLQGTDEVKDEDIDKMMEAATIIMEGIDPELASDKEALEEALDVEVFWKMFAVAMGSRLEDDPNV